MKKNITKIILILAVIAVMAIPPVAKAENATTICNQLFAGDSTNIFKEVLCSLTRVTSRTIADLATNTTCTIQSVGNASNYNNSIVFKSSSIGSPQCDSSSNWLTGTPTNPPGQNTRPPFGDKTAGSINSGLYASNAQSQLSQNLSPSGNLSGPFGISRAIMVVLAFIALLIFAFANILHIDVNSYAIKKALPSVLIALIGGTLSLLIIFIFSRGVDQLYRFNMFDPAHTINQMNNMFTPVTGAFTSQNFTSTGPGTGADTAADIAATNNSVSLIFSVGGRLLGNPASSNFTFVNGLFGSILLTIPAILVIVFQYVLALRPFAISLLTIVAPFAFACLILPQTQIIFRKWWTYLLIALFYAPIVNFIFYITNLITSGAYSTSAGPVAFIAAWVFNVAIFIFLIRLPFTVESDVRKITALVAKTSFGEALGLGRFAGLLSTSGQTREIKATADKVNISASKTLSSDETKNLIAATASSKKVISRQVGSTSELQKLRSQPFVSAVAIPNLSTILNDANNTNLNRSPNLMIRSVSDIKPDIFKAVVDQSDLKLWRDTRLIEQLKNQNGQVLGNEGVALRSDAIRKIVRLSQVTQDGHMANPDAIRLLAQKGALNSLPLDALKQAVKEGILAKEDFRATYQNNTEKVFPEMLSAAKPFQLDPRSARELMQRDHQDYRSGYKDLSALFSTVSKDQRLIPPPSAEVIKNIIGQMKTTDSNSFERNGLYYLSRLQGKQKDSQAQIASSLKQAGTPSRTASAIAVNPRLDFAQAKNYYSQDKMTGENLQMLREGFMGRDLSNNLIKEISDIVIQEKSMIGKGVTQKIASGLKGNETIELSDIRDSMKTLVSKMIKPMSPQEVQGAAREINKYHPAAIIVTPATAGTTDLDKLKSNAEDVIETTEHLIAAGIQKETLLENPMQAQNTVEQKVRDKVRQEAIGEPATSGKAGPKQAIQATKVPAAMKTPPNVEISGSVEKTIQDLAAADKAKPPASVPPLSENKKGQQVEKEIEKISQQDTQTAANKV